VRIEPIFRDYPPEACRLAEAWIYSPPFSGRLPMFEHFIVSLPFRSIGFYPSFHAQKNFRGRKAKTFQEAGRVLAVRPSL
jgi:hypothetical protein